MVEVHRIQKYSKMPAFSVFVIYSEAFAREIIFVPARHKRSKKRSLHKVNEYFEIVYNAAGAESMNRAMVSQ